MNKLNDYICGFPFNNQKNYLGESFGHPICISVNNTIAHGRPENYIPKLGDVISVDCGVSIPYGTRQLHLDAAFTVSYNKTEPWVNAPLYALKKIIAQQPSDTMEIAKIIRQTAKDNNLNQVVSLTGHGIGYKLHEAPAIHNAPGNFLSVELFEGLCFCAEPIFVHPGKDKKSSFICPTYIGTDGWKIITANDLPSSHFETTFGIINGQIVDLIGVTNWLL